MKPIRNITTLTLMVSSLGLLLLLQGFWLFNSYEKAFYTLDKDIDGLFRNTVMALRDSSLMQFIEKLPPDSSGHDKSNIVYAEQKDSSGRSRQWQVRESSTQLSVFIRSSVTGDTLKNLLTPLMSKVQDGKIRDGNFVIRMGPDSLRLDSINKYFRKALLSTNRQLSFEVKKISHQINFTEPLGNRLNRAIRMRQSDSHIEPGSILSDTVKSDWVRTDPAHRYSASVFGVRPYLLKEITPQILFSFFLTALTSIAFIVMYRSIRAQQRLMEIKNDFISNITHELKTPVTTVSVALEALKDFNGLENPQRTEEYLNIAQSELNRLTILTDKILKTAIFENKGVNYEPESVDLFKTLEQVLHSMKLVFEKQKAKVSFEKVGETFTINGGSVHLTNVIYNLLDNALKYSSGEPIISVTLTENQGQVVLKVADKGIGIPKEYSKKIFEKFFRVPAGDVHNVKGYGLGLSYVESVVKSHKGKIEVESESGSGTTFTISLPKNKIELAY